MLKRLSNTRLIQSQILERRKNIWNVLNQKTCSNYEYQDSRVVSGIKLYTVGALRSFILLICTFLNEKKISKWRVYIFMHYRFYIFELIFFFLWKIIVEILTYSPNICRYFSYYIDISKCSRFIRFMYTKIFKNLVSARTFCMTIQKKYRKSVDKTLGTYNNM